MGRWWFKTDLNNLRNSMATAQVQNQWIAYELEAGSHWD